MSIEQPNKQTNEQQDQKIKLESAFYFGYLINKEYVTDQNTQHKIDSTQYQNQVKKIADFDTIQDFWAIFQHLRKPDSCKPGIEFHMFKQNIKPLWEVDENKNGGRITVRLNHGYTTIIWEEMIFALIGGILPKEVKDEINGIIVSCKANFNVLHIWFANFDNAIKKLNLEQHIKDLLQIPSEIKLNVENFKDKLANSFNKNKKGFNRGQLREYNTIKNE